MKKAEALNGKSTLDRLIDLAMEAPIKPSVITLFAAPVVSVPVVYVIPAMDELRRRFPGFVNEAYDGITFTPIEACKGTSRKPRKVEFGYVYLNRRASTESALDEIGKRGLRPALPEELLAFAKKYPDEQRKFPIVALGSETRVGGDRRVASLEDGDSRRLDLTRISGHWFGVCRFLAVRE